MENLLFLGVPILKHIRVYPSFESCVILGSKQEVTKLSPLVEFAEMCIFALVLHGIINSFTIFQGHYRYSQAFYELGQLERAIKVNKLGLQLCEKVKDSDFNSVKELEEQGDRFRLGISVTQIRKVNRHNLGIIFLKWHNLGIIFLITP